MPEFTERIRDQFPALSRIHAGQPVAYFDGPGGTQVPRSVVDAMSDYLFNHNANTHWAYPTSEETDSIILGARQALADFLNADSREIAFGQNMTTLTFHLARALVREWREGDEIVVTDLDHRANVDPWLEVARDHGIRVRSVRVDPATCRLDEDDLRAALSGRPRLLAIGAASNAVGTITDVAAATRLAHEASAQVFVDAVHYAPHQLVDVRAIDCDFLACSPYKFYGPHLGVLYGRHDILASIDVPKVQPASNSAPERIETGTLSHESIAGAGAAVNFLASLGEGASRRLQLVSAYRQLHERGGRLLQQLWSGLRSLPGVTLYGPHPGTPRTPTVSFTVDGVSSTDIARGLADNALFVSSGDFYASTVVRQLGLGDDGLVRVGCSCYTTAAEVERVVERLGEIGSRT